MAAQHLTQAEPLTSMAACNYSFPLPSNSAVPSSPCQAFPLAFSPCMSVSFSLSLSLYTIWVCCVLKCVYVVLICVFMCKGECMYEYVCVNVCNCV